jgi:hypothetical protein
MGLKSYALGRSAYCHPNKASAFADKEADKKRVLFFVHEGGRSASASHS